MKHTDWTKNSVIYELNIRQFTEEGTFNAIIKHLPRLKEMGVDIIWLMPIHPVGVKNRKGSLGSYYSVKDFKDVNQEFGTKKDFQNLVNKTHESGMKIIIDWVANHSSWDNIWTKTNPDFYDKDDSGSFISPYDWTDAISLNYENPEMRNSMIDALKYWVKDYDIDGFRCDVAGMVPTNFWERARKELDEIKPVFMLAEDEENESLLKNAFDMNYNWKLHKLMNAIAKGEKKSFEIKNYFLNNYNNYKKDNYRMIFTSNHDENSWNGTVFERLGGGVKAFAALCFVIPGLPLIYSGQEAAMNKRLKFFDKDTIDWKDYPLQDFYTDLIKLKTENQSIWNGKHGGDFIEIKNSSDDKILSFIREMNNNKVLSVFNLSNKTVSFNIKTNFDKTIFEEYFSKSKTKINKNKSFVLAPWEYKVFINNE